jgi:hypothetical protein
VLADANYIFHVAGQDGNGNYYLAGAFTVQNGVITAGEQDMVDGGGNNFMDTLTASGPNSGIPAPFALAGYTVGTNQVQLVETPTGNSQEDLGAVLGGVALGQGSNTGKFNQTNVAANSYAFGANGDDGYGNVQIGGNFILNANGTVSGNLSLNDLTYHFGSQITSGTYTVDSTGRVTLNANITSGSLPNNPTFTFQLYLDGNGNVLELGVDDFQATSGLSFLQQAPSSDYEGNYALNAYGYSSINIGPAWAAIGPVTVASDSLSGYTDYSIQNAQNTNSVVTPAVSLSGTEDSSRGLFQLYGLAVTGANGPYTPDPQAQSGFGYWPIDANRMIALELDGQQMSLMILEATQP